MYYSPLLELDDIKIFEIGNVFHRGREESMLALGALSKNKGAWKALKVELEATTKELFSQFHSKFSDATLTSGQFQDIYEVNFDALVGGQPFQHFLPP
jgi:predicted butyrate kinase (DUF1464 family)